MLLVYLLKYNLPIFPLKLHFSVPLASVVAVQLEWRAGNHQMQMHLRLVVLIS